MERQPQRERPVLRPGQRVGEQRAAVGAPQPEHHRRRAPSAELLRLHLEVAPDAVHLVARAVAVHLLVPEVAVVEHRVRGAPRDGRRAPEHDGGHARQGGPHRGVGAAAHAREVPHARQREGEVRVVREDRRARRAPAAADDPRVAARDRRVPAEEREGLPEGARVARGRAREPERGRLAGARGPREDRPQVLGCVAQHVGDRGEHDARAPLEREAEGHALAHEARVERRPRLDRQAHQPVLDRRRGPEPRGHRVDALGVRLDEAAVLRRRRVERAPRRADEVERAHQPVGVEGGATRERRQRVLAERPLPHDLAQAARERAPHQVHLEEAVERVARADGPEGVGLVRRAHVGHAEAVEHDRRGRREARHLHRTRPRPRGPRPRARRRGGRRLERAAHRAARAAAAAAAAAAAGGRARGTAPAGGRRASRTPTLGGSSVAHSLCQTRPISA